MATTATTTTTATATASTTTTSIKATSSQIVAATDLSVQGHNGTSHELTGSLTQALYRFTLPTLNQPTGNQSVSITAAKPVHGTRPTNGLKISSPFGIPDLSPQQFWSYILTLPNPSDHLTVLLNGDLIRDRHRNKSLPCEYFSSLLTASPAYIKRTATLTVRTGNGGSPPQELSTYLKHGLQFRSHSVDTVIGSWESDFLHGQFSAKLEITREETAAEGLKMVRFIVVGNEFLVDSSVVAEDSKKERSLQLFFDFNDLPPSPSSPLLQIGLLGPSTTFLPARQYTFRHSLLSVRRSGYSFLQERLSGYLRRWNKWTGVAPQYRERRYLIAERKPRTVERVGGMGGKGMEREVVGRIAADDGVSAGDGERESGAVSGVLAIDPSSSSNLQLVTTASLVPISEKSVSPELPQSTSKANTAPHRQIPRHQPVAPSKISVPSQRPVISSPEKPPPQTYVRSGIPRPLRSPIKPPSTLPLARIPIPSDAKIAKIRPLTVVSTGNQQISDRKGRGKRPSEDGPSLHMNKRRKIDTEDRTVNAGDTAGKSTPVTRIPVRSRFITASTADRSAGKGLSSSLKRTWRSGRIGQVSSSTAVGSRRRTPLGSLARQGRSAVMEGAGNGMKSSVRSPVKGPTDTGTGSLIPRLKSSPAKQSPTKANSIISKPPRPLRIPSPSSSTTTLPSPLPTRLPTPEPRLPSVPPSPSPSPEPTLPIPDVFTDTALPAPPPTPEPRLPSIPPSPSPSPEPIPIPDTSTGTAALAAPPPTPEPVPASPSLSSDPIPIPDTSVGTPIVKLPSPATLLRNVALLNHATPASVTFTLRPKLNYGLSHLSSLPASVPIPSITKKQLLALLLNSRQLGRMTRFAGERKPCRVTLSRCLGDTDLQAVLWEGHRVEGLLMRGIQPESGAKRDWRICVYGCTFPQEGGLHQWLSDMRHSLRHHAGNARKIPCMRLPHELLGTPLDQPIPYTAANPLILYYKRTPNSHGHQTSLFALGKALLLKCFQDEKCVDEDIAAWYEFETGDKEFVEK